METNKPVVIKRLPANLDNGGARRFYADVEPLLRSDRPQLVFDLSLVERLDVSGVEVLLRCMREVMRRDGDLKLAALSSSAATVLELTRADRLFEIYETSTDAARSYSCFLPRSIRRPPFQQERTAA
jgi:anti-sigma B factor antagonist